jgi:Xaa-Pro dipeptidase
MKRGHMSRSSIEKEIPNRLTRLQNQLSAQHLGGAILVQKVDLYYFSGTDQDAHLWVPASGTPVLMVRKSLERALEDSPMEKILPLPAFSHLPELIKAHTGKVPKRFGLEMDVLPAGLFMTYQKLFPGTEMVDISALIRGIRMIKSPYEVSCITQAAKMGDGMFEQVPLFLKDSKTETDLALRLEAHYRSKGHPGLVRARGFNMELFYGHVMSGRNAAVPSSSPGPTGGMGLGPFYSQGAGMKIIGRHEPILVDYTSNVRGYVADQARIFSLGKLKEKFLHAHDVMLEVQEALSQQGLPGVCAGNLYNVAQRIVEKAGLSQGFMGYPDPVPFVGHGVGIELDEWPVIGRNIMTILEEGMVIALEPKFVLPGEGVVGIENTFVVTLHGLKKLNRFRDSIVAC